MIPMATSACIPFGCVRECKLMYEWCTTLFEIVDSYPVKVYPVDGCAEVITAEPYGDSMMSIISTWYYFCSNPECSDETTPAEPNGKKGGTITETVFVKCSSTKKS
jgi:hypothetical protein